MVNMWINEKYCFYQFKHFRRYLPTKEEIMTIDFWIYNRIKVKYMTTMKQRP